MKRYATTILLWLSVIVSEVHTLFEKSSGVYNWIVAKYVPMQIQWNVKYAMMELWNVLIFGAIVFWKDNRTNKASAKAMLVVAFLDAALYFYNFKTKYYGWVYLALILSFIYFYRNGNRTTNRQRDISFIK